MPGVVQIDHGFTHVDANLAGRNRQRLTDQWQFPRRVGEGARNQSDRRSGRVQQQLAAALRGHFLHAAQARHGLREFRREIGRFAGTAGGGGADIEVGRQHHIQPLHDRAAKTRHHHRQGHRQAQRRDDAADRHAGALAHAAGALHRQQGQGVPRHQRRQAVQQQRNQPRQRRDAAQQQQRNRHIGCQRYAENGWSPCHHYTYCYQNDTKPVMATGHKAAAQTFERLRQWQALGLSRRPPAPHQRRQHAQSTVGQSRPSTPLQGRRHAGKVAATEVAAEQAQRQGRQGGTEGDAGHAADPAQHQRFEQHQTQPVTPAQTQHAQQGKLLGALGHAQGQHREHQKGPGKQGHQRQHREVDAVGARQVADARRSVAGLGHGDAGGPVGGALQGLRKGRPVGASLQADIDAAELTLFAKQFLRGADVHHRQWRASRVDAAHHRHFFQLQGALQQQCVAAEALARTGVQKHIVGREQGQPVGVRRG